MPRTFPGDDENYGRVISVTPKHGPASGGTPVVVTGGGSDWPTVVEILFGDNNGTIFKPATGFTRLPNNDIECVTPQFKPGPARVTAKAKAGHTFMRRDAYTYTVVPAPSIDEIKPKLGPEDGGIALHITGSGFKEGHK